MDCTDGAYKANQLFATVLVIVYPVGVPLVLFLLMWRQRGELRDEGSKKREEFNPVVGAYTTEQYNWEVVETVRKLILTGLMCFIRRGSVTQLVLGAIVSSIFFGAAVKFQPYQLPFNNRLKMLADAAVTATFNIAILLTDTVESAGDGVGLTKDMLGVALIAINIVAPTALLVHYLATQGCRKINQARAKSNDRDVNDREFEFDNPMAVDNAEDQERSTSSHTMELE